MKTSKIKLSVFFIILSFGLTLNAQTKWINGFADRIAGENLDYHSCHPDANLSLLIRCLNDKDYIEWATDTIPSDYKNNFVTFAWIAGYSVATSTAPHKFYLYINDGLQFEFKTSPDQEKKDWELTDENGSKLHFKFIKVDAVDDFFGYMVLTIPTKLLNGNKFARIKVKGDATNSKDWYMTMQYPLIPKIRIEPEKVVSKDSSGNLLQRVKVSIDHFDSPKPVQISAEGKKHISSELKLGMNDFYLNFAAPQKPKEVKINIAINGETKTFTTIIKPARKITFYLIPHAHVDIGYTDLQPNIARKHWSNYEKALEYSKESLKYGKDATFRWNVEVLWAVKSYLENHPNKRKEFYDAVKKGWIGLDATYANLLTGLSRPEELYQWVEYSNILEKKIGTKIESAMISDVPGYTWGVVQAFADNGIKYFSVGPNPGDRIGYTLKDWGDKPFYWKSPSGKEKILVWVAGKGYAWFHGWRLTRDDFTPMAKYLDQLDSENYPYDMVHLRYNIGGDNGFPDSLLPAWVKHWNDTHVTPKFKISTTDQMFKDFEAKYSKVIPTYSGDFTPYWEDGAASTARETAMNRNTAELLAQLETMYTLFDYKNFPQKEFDEAWQYVLLFSEHTWGAWNSISDPELKSVKEQWEIKKSYAVKADSIAEKLLYDLANETQINKEYDEFYVCNPSSWERSGIVTIPAPKGLPYFTIRDQEGNLIPSQKLSNGSVVFTAKDIPALGYKGYKIVKGENENKIDSPLNAYTLSNNFYKLTFNDSTFALKDLSIIGENFNYIDSTDNYGFNQFIHSGTNASNITLSSNPKLVSYENGPVLKSITVKSQAQGCNSLSQDIVLFNDLDKIEIINTIDKKKDYAKENIRFAFPSSIKNPVSRINIAWAVIRPETDQLTGANKNYFTAQRWIDISNNYNGLSIAPVDAPLVEFGGMTGEAWMASPDREWASHTSSSALCYSWVMNNSWHTNYKASQEGVASFRYFLKPHKEFNYLEDYKFGVESSQPLRIIYNSNTIKNYNQTIKLDPSSSIVISVIYPSRDGTGTMLRIFNPTDKQSSSYLTWLRSSKVKLFLSDGDEDNKQEISNNIKLDPFEVMTIKIKER